MNALELFSLKDYVCVVTGVAAPKGLGMAMCRALGDAGAKMVISDITENVHSAADTLREAGYQVAETVADTTTIEGAEKVRDTALNAYGKIDVLVNNALPLMKGIDECTYEEFQYALSVGVTAPFYLVKLLKEHKGPTPLHLFLVDPETKYNLEFVSKKYSVGISDTLLDSLLVLGLKYTITKKPS